MMTAPAEPDDEAKGAISTVPIAAYRQEPHQNTTVPTAETTLSTAYLLRSLSQPAPRPPPALQILKARRASHVTPRPLSVTSGDAVAG